MNDPTYMAAFVGFLASMLMGEIWWRRIKTKIFIGDGGDVKLKQTIEQFNTVFKCGTIGLLLLFALDNTAEDGPFKSLFQICAGFLLFFGLITDGKAKRENGVMSFGYVIGRGSFIVMTTATSLYLFYLWFTVQIQ